MEFERIALRRQRRQPFLRFEKTELTHLRVLKHAIAHETRTANSEWLFFEAPSTSFIPRPLLNAKGHLLREC
jgi:hypothetical protein